MEIKETSQVLVDTTAILIIQIAGNINTVCFHIVSPAFCDIFSSKKTENF